MLETRGNLWEFDADFVCITTNGTVRKDGKAVMGRGCALEAAQLLPVVPEVLGLKLAKYGNHVHYLRHLPKGNELLSFPVKHHWKQRADLDLILRSAEELVHYVDFWSPTDSYVQGKGSGYKPKVVLPRPGCGNGQLDWDVVRPVIEPVLDDRFTVITW